MKYMYILLCIMSSFFANKSLATEGLYTKYAFFMPTNVYQNNSETKPINIQPTRQQQPKQSIHQNKSNLSQNPKTTSKTAKKTVTTKKTKKATVTKKPIIQTSSNFISKPTQKPKPQTKYKLDENITQAKPIVAQIEPTIEEPQDISMQEKHETENLIDLLREIPYPDSNLPKFKQIYNLYALELRTLYRHGSFPYNLEQDKILSKANSIRRFEVE